MTSSGPLVSVVVPTFQCRAWIGEAVDSALAQTYPDIEVIVVDDGSTDGTGPWLRERYGDAIRYHLVENGGAARARNLGIELARGSFIQFLDADDFLLPQKIEAQLQVLVTEPRWALAYGDAEVVHERRPQERRPWPPRHRYVSGDVLDELVTSGFFIPAQALVRGEWVERVGGFDEALPSNEDWDFFLRIAAAGGQFIHHPAEPTAVYRLRSGSRSHRGPEHAQAAVMVLDKLERAIDDVERRRELDIRGARADWRFTFGRSLVASGQFRSGWLAMARATLEATRGRVFKTALLLLTPVLGLARAEHVTELGRRRVRGREAEPEGWPSGEEGS